MSGKGDGIAKIRLIWEWVVKGSEIVVVFCGERETSAFSYFLQQCDVDDGPVHEWQSQTMLLLPDWRHTGPPI